MVQWNKVTWYSRLGAIIFIFGVFTPLVFYIGVRYEQVREDGAQFPAMTATLNYYYSARHAYQAAHPSAH